MRHFVGERLREARLARNMTASALAELIGVAASSISHYERRSVDPRPNILSQMAQALSMPESYFLREPLTPDPAPYLYRSYSSATKKAREGAEVRLRWFREIVDFVSSEAELPTIDVPDHSSTPNPAAISMEDAEAAAVAVRRHWKLGDGPVPNTLALLESKGCAVSKFSFGADTLDAFSQNAQQRPCIAINSDNVSCVRIRFDAAHELGHLVLHRLVPPNVAALPEHHKLMERQAHRFAAAFLFPASSFAEDVYSLSLDTLVALKRRWKVSIQMMLRRARDLSLVSQDRYERACVEISRKGFRKHEPLDDELPVERPVLMMKAFQLIIDSGVMTRAAVLYKLPYSASDIEVLASLPRGYLEKDDWGDIVSLRPRPQPAVEQRSLPGVGGGEVIPFRRKV